MHSQYQVSLFRAEQTQHLRNVTIHSPSIVQIISGSKRLFAYEKLCDLAPTDLLLCSFGETLSFENRPEKGRFLSRVFSFYVLPTPAMVKQSLGQKKFSAYSAKQPSVLSRHSVLADTLNALYSFDQQNLSRETQIFWLMGLYQQLAEMGVLHLLFPERDVPLSHKLSRYLAQNPAEPHSVITSSQHFAMSRATLIRKLKSEGTQYRDVLTEVRLNYALQLMQQGQCRIIAVAQQCGYQSEGRFSLRFKEKFGISPRSYIQTLKQN